MKPIMALLCLSYFLAACSDNTETVAANNESSGAVYYDYQVWAEEGREDVTVRLQYRRGGDEGNPILLDEPSKVLLDGTALTADSTGFMGVFYEVGKPVDEFKGKHVILFVDRNRKEHREEFTFQPFTLAEELPDKLQKKPFRIVLQDFPQTAATVRLAITDTSFQSADVNEEVVVEDGKIDITADHLANLTKGPVVLELYREQENPVGNNSKNRGKLTMTYSLKRQFVLAE